MIVPAVGKVLEWVRISRGLDVPEAAERLGIPVEDLLAYESDTRKPSLTLFETMASRYRVTQATLFLKEPPSRTNELVDFRTVAGDKTDRHRFEFRVAISNIRSLLHSVERLAEEDDEFLRPRLHRIKRTDDPELAGERERKRLGIPVADQFSWRTSEAFGRWRAHLEATGVLVFQQKFPIDDGRGFSIYDSADTPTVVVNKEENTQTAKAFTIWHEYCHLLLREPGVSDLGENDVEAFCNKFAAAFLIPTEALRTLLPHWPNEPIEWSREDIERWAGKLKVSQRALALRLEEKQLAPKGFSMRFAWTAAPRPAAKSGGGSYLATRLSEIGSAYAERHVSALDRNLIDRVQLAEALGIAPNNETDVRNYVRRNREMAGVS